MCGFSLVLFSSHVTCSLVWEACKSFPFNHTIQESSQPMPRCLLFSMIPAWNSMSPFKLKSFFKLWKIFFLVWKFLLLLHLLPFFPSRFIIHVMSSGGFFLPRLFFPLLRTISVFYFCFWLCVISSTSFPSSPSSPPIRFKFKITFPSLESIFFCIWFFKMLLSFSFFPLSCRSRFVSSCSSEWIAGSFS